MTISNPEPGELVRTVAELVTAVNAGGSGGGSSSILQIAGPDPSVQLADSTPYVIEWDPAAVGGIFYLSRGTEISWAGIGDEATIDINSDGFYDISFTATCSPGTDPSAIQAGLLYNGSLDTLSAGSPSIAIVDSSFPAPFGTCGFTVFSHAAFAGDTFGVQINQTGNSSDDTTILYSVLSIAKRA